MTRCSYHACDACIKTGTYYASHAKKCVGLWVSNAAFNNILVISWLLVMLMEKTGVSVKKLQPAAIKLLIITVGILNFPTFVISNLISP